MSTFKEVLTTRSPDILNAILKEVRLLRLEVSLLLPEESIEEYKHPARLKASLKRALRDWKTGNVSSTL